MNRKDRRALQKRDPAVAARTAMAATTAAPLLAEASRYEGRGKLQEAARLYRRALAINPGDAQVHNNLACALLALGKPREASAQFAQALAHRPELFGQYAEIIATLFRVLPAMQQAATRAAAAWPRLLSIADLFGPAGLSAIAGDAMLRALLETETVRSFDLECVLTSLRAALLRMAADGTAAEPTDADILAFCCALARQCFINEYVFACTNEEHAAAERLAQTLNDAAASGQPCVPLWLAAVASYVPLASLPAAQSLLDRDWPDPVAQLLTQQVREPREEQQYRASIARLTPIDDPVSLQVQRQYEENPYPRWVAADAPRLPVSLDEYLRRRFPLAAFRDLGKTAALDVLVAGCGTGKQSVEIARLFKDAQLLAVDLSLTSLCYARRKTQEMGLSNIEYAQADILHLGAIDRSFDLIDASGVLHHLADPMAGWRVLLARLRPGGFMRLALYSTLARAEVAAARRYVAERGYGSAVADIRRCRQELMTTPLRGVANFYDFFSTSECRDLLFHVQEHTIAIPDISAFVAAHGLTFIGFENVANVADAYGSFFPDDRAMTGLDNWHVFETRRPGTFAGMYQFWIQKG